MKILIFFTVAAISVIYGFNVDRLKRHRHSKEKTAELQWFGDLSEAENAMIVMFFTGDLQALPWKKMLALRAVWEQLKSECELPHCTYDQAAKMQQIWQKCMQTGGGQVSKEIRTEMEGVFTKKQMQKIKALRKKVVQLGGTSVAPFFQQTGSAETNTTQTNTTEIFPDLTDTENAMISVFFTADLHNLTSEQIVVLRAVWEQLKSAGKLPQCTRDQRTRLQQIWQKYKQSGGGEVSKEIRDEMEGVFTSEQMKKITVLRQKVMQKGGSSVAQFFQQIGSVETNTTQINTTQTNTTEFFEDLSDAENAMIVMFFTADLQKLPRKKMLALRAIWEQLKSERELPQCTSEQAAKMQQIWQKYMQTGGGQVSKEIRTEMEGVFTSEQMQKITALREKVVKLGGTSVEQFFLQSGSVETTTTQTNENESQQQKNTTKLFQDLSDDENAMIVVFFTADLYSLTIEQKTILRTKWEQMKASGELPQITNEQKTKLQQIWQKSNEADGNITSEIRTEMENVFTSEQMQKFAILREKVVQESGNSFAQFFQQSGQIQVKSAKIFDDLSEEENAMIVVFFNGNLQQLTSEQKWTLRTKWEQLKTSGESGELPQGTDAQKAKLHQIWQNYTQTGGEITEEIRNELESVFTSEQTQKFAVLREKVVQEGGSSFAQFFKQNQVKETAELFEDLSEVENAMIVVLFNGNLQNLTDEQKTILRTKWNQLKSTDELHKCTKEQEAKLQQIWQKRKQTEGHVTDEIRTELENVFTEEEKQKIFDLREKIAQENGFAQFFETQTKTENLKIFVDLSDDENAKISAIFDGNLQLLSNEQKAVLRAKWDQMRSSGEMFESSEDQKTKLQQTWEKFKKSDGKISKSLRTEMEQIFTEEQMQSVIAIRKKYRQELGESFFQSQANGHQGEENEKGKGDTENEEKLEGDLNSLEKIGAVEENGVGEPIRKHPGHRRANADLFVSAEIRG